MKKSGIYAAVEDHTEKTCVIQGIDVKDTLPFTRCPDDIIESGAEDKFWEEIQQARPEGARARALFLDQPSGPVLQMIGAKYVTSK